MASSDAHIPCGVPQGSVLGPLLFLCYVNDLQNRIQCSGCIQYADDLALVVSVRDTTRLYQLLQEDLTAVETWCQENRLTINTEKT